MFMWPLHRFSWCVLRKAFRHETRNMHHAGLSYLTLPELSNASARRAYHVGDKNKRGMGLFAACPKHVTLPAREFDNNHE